jgi:hypothetical protein
VRKVSQAQARSQKRAKKTKEAEVSLEPHASTVSSDDVSASFPFFLFMYFNSYTLFFCYQALVKRFITLGTECAGYLKVAKASEGKILIFM